MRPEKRAWRADAAYRPDAKEDPARGPYPWPLPVAGAKRRPSKGSREAAAFSSFCPFAHYAIKTSARESLLSAVAPFQNIRPQKSCRPACGSILLQPPRVGSAPAPAPVATARLCTQPASAPANPINNDWCPIKNYSKFSLK